MKYILIPFVLLLMLASCSKSQPVNIAGTRILLVAPEGYVQARNFVGLKKGGNKGIEASEAAENYYVLTSNYEAQLQAKGAKILSHEDLRIGGYPAKLLNLQLNNMQATPLTAWCMVFGDSTFFATLMGAYADDDTSDEIRERHL